MRNIKRHEGTERRLNRIRDRIEGELKKKRRNREN